MERFEEIKKYISEMSLAEKEALLKWLEQHLNVSAQEARELAFEAAAERTFQKYGPAIKKLAAYDSE